MDAVSSFFIDAYNLTVILYANDELAAMGVGKGNAGFYKLLKFN